MLELIRLNNIQKPKLSLSFFQSSISCNTSTILARRLSNSRSNFSSSSKFKCVLAPLISERVYCLYYNRSCAVCFELRSWMAVSSEGFDILINNLCLFRLKIALLFTQSLGMMFFPSSFATIIAYRNSNPKAQLWSHTERNQVSSFRASPKIRFSSFFINVVSWIKPK